MHISCHNTCKHPLILCVCTTQNTFPNLMNATTTDTTRMYTGTNLTRPNNPPIQHLQDPRGSPFLRSVKYSTRTDLHSPNLKSQYHLNVPSHIFKNPTCKSVYYMCSFHVPPDSHRFSLHANPRFFLPGIITQLYPETKLVILLVDAPITLIHAYNSPRKTPNYQHKNPYTILPPDHSPHKLMSFHAFINQQENQRFNYLP